MKKITIPKWFWGLALFLLLWNIMGVFSFFAHTFISEEALALLPIEQQELYSSYPTWTTFVFAIAVFFGFIGSIALLLKKKFAKPAFLISLCAIIPQMVHNVLFTKSIEVYGIIQTVTMPILVILLGVFALWFSSSSIHKGWLK